MYYQSKQTELIRAVINQIKKYLLNISVSQALSLGVWYIENVNEKICGLKELKWIQRNKTIPWKINNAKCEMQFIINVSRNIINNKNEPNQEYKKFI